MAWRLRFPTGDREQPPANRQLIEEFWTDAGGRTRVRFLANSLGLAIGAVTLSLVLGWAIFVEPALALRILAAATLFSITGLGLIALVLARKSSSNRPANRLALSTWGVEFDAPETRPDLAPAESGGALAWIHVRHVEMGAPFWAMKRCGLTEVRFYSREYRRGWEGGIAVPIHWPWGIVVPYLPPERAERILSIARSKIDSSGPLPAHS